MTKLRFAGFFCELEHGDREGPSLAKAREVIPPVELTEARSELERMDGEALVPLSEHLGRERRWPEPR